MKDILKLLAEGQISLEDAERRLKLCAVHEHRGMAKWDIGRNSRVRKPEIVSAKAKTDERVISLAQPRLDAEG